MNKRILKLAIPSVISNISIPLLGMVDLGLVGHLKDIRYIGAVALGTMIFNFIYWGFGFLRMGTSGFTAQSYGARNLTGSVLTLSRSLLLGLAGAFLILVLQKPIALISFSLLHGSPAVETEAMRYFYIRVWAAPATIALYSFTGWFIGMQNTRFPMIITVVVNGLNVLFSLFFVLHLDMNSDGVALGTVLAQYSGLLLSIFLYQKYYGRLNKRWSFGKMADKKAVKEFLFINKDIFIRTLFLIFAFSYFTAESARMGDQILAINTLLLQYFMFFSYLIDGFAYAAEALTGKYVGSGSLFNLKKSVRILFLWGMGLSIPFTLTYLGGSHFILRLLTNNATLIQQASPFLLWIALVPLVSFPAFLFDGIFIGATASKGMRNSMILATVVFYLPVYYLLRSHFGNHALWFAFILFLISRGVLLSGRLKKEVYSKCES